MIGIFGGTFDPVHLGHTQTIAFVQQALSLDYVHLVPLGQAVHRQQPVASAQQRLQMLQAATTDNDKLIIDDREIKRPGGSYTVDTLISIQSETPKQTLCLITGNDAFEGFLSWHKPEKILQLAHIIVMQRPNCALHASQEMQILLDKSTVTDYLHLTAQPAGNILFQTVPQLDISSTKIRQHIQSGQVTTAMLAAPVLQLISQWKLYQNPKNQPAET